MDRYHWTAWGLVDTLAADVERLADELSVQGATPRLGGGACGYRLPPRPTRTQAREGNRPAAGLDGPSERGR